MKDKLVQTWRKIIIGNNKSWVLFQNGTCVILMQPQSDLKQQAITLMKEYGPVHAGSSFGDFCVIALTEDTGWVVECHHPDILTYVAPDEVAQDESDDIQVGLLGRSKRGADATELIVIHVEDSRKIPETE